MKERLQKILARAGYGSRRVCEQIIADGRVRINGCVARLGDKAFAERDDIQVDGHVVAAAESKTYIALYKPRGVLSTTSDQKNRSTVRDLVSLSETLYPVGRLDADSEGLVLLTNDGELANRLTHPRYAHEKEYRVLVARQPDARQLEIWRNGVVLEDGFRTHPAKVSIGSKLGKGVWLRVILKEGHKRQIREMGRQTGLPVVRIIRVRIGSLWLGTLGPRQWRHLTMHEVKKLQIGEGDAIKINKKDNSIERY